MLRYILALKLKEKEKREVWYSLYYPISLLPFKIKLLKKAYTSFLQLLSFPSVVIVQVNNYC